VDAALSRKLLINSPRPSALRFMPALNVTADEIDAMVRTLEESISSVRGSS
jgi:acetylornithine/N-succinyldiaminopimelate aminotransferase